MTVTKINRTQPPNPKFSTLHQTGSFCLAYKNSTKNIFCVPTLLCMYEVTPLEQLRGEETARPRPASSR